MAHPKRRTSTKRRDKNVRTRKQQLETLRLVQKQVSLTCTTVLIGTRENFITKVE